MEISNALRKHGNAILGAENEKSAYSVKKQAHQITKAGRDSKWIINSFLSIIIGIRLARSWERGQKIESVLCR